MKTYIELSVTDKAKLLHELFPGEIAGLIQFSKELIDIIITDPGTITGYSADLLHSTPFWLELVNKAKSTIEENDIKLSTDSDYFSLMLFGNYQSIFGLYCLHQYIISGKCSNRKFKQAIEFLFFF